MSYKIKRDIRQNHVGVFVNVFIHSADRVLVRKGFYFTLDSFQANEAHRVESDLNSIGFKIMFDKWISRHDTYIAVQKGLGSLSATIGPTS